MSNELLNKAIKELNEKDAEGVVAKIKMRIKMINDNDAKIAMYQKANEVEKKEIAKLVNQAPITAERFVSEAE